MTDKYEQRKKWVESFVRHFYSHKQSGRLTVHFDPEGLPCKVEPTPVYKPPQAGRRKNETG